MEFNSRFIAEDMLKILESNFQSNFIEEKKMSGVIK